MRHRLIYHIQNVTNIMKRNYIFHLPPANAYQIKYQLVAI